MKRMLKILVTILMLGGAFLITQDVLNYYNIPEPIPGGIVAAIIVLIASYGTLLLVKIELKGEQNE